MIIRFAELKSVARYPQHVCLYIHAPFSFLHIFQKCFPKKNTVYNKKFEIRFRNCFFFFVLPIFLSFFFPMQFGPIRSSDPILPAEDNVCPWESISSAITVGSSRTKSLIAGPSVDQTEPQTPIGGSPSAKKSSFSCSIDSHLPTDVCPWDSASAVLPASGGTRTKMPAAKSSIEVAPGDIVCPWESQEPETAKVTTVKSPSEVTVVVLHPSKQASPIISLAGSSGGSGHCRKESASGITVPESATEQADKSSSKISDICPWEDE